MVKPKGKIIMDRKSETEEKIVQAAARIFLQKGKEGARMQEIADQAGINKALLHYYFRSKDKLFLEVFKNQMEIFFDGLINALEETDQIEIGLRYFIDTYIDIVSKNVELIHFIFWEIQKNSEIVLNRILSRRNLQKNPFIDFLEKAIEKKQIRPIDPCNFVISLFGLCIYPFLAKPVLEKVFLQIDVTSADFLRLRKKEVFDLVWNGISLDHSQEEKKNAFSGTCQSTQCRS
ncbi:putative HTH-type transcriptional regulator YttP [bacterium BMS3Bbin03]|nr:putative HTH-type transcriptional regulator YttP [bacterium BMS3Bbin03]